MADKKKTSWTTWVLLAAVLGLSLWTFAGPGGTCGVPGGPANADLAMFASALSGEPAVAQAPGWSRPDLDGVEHSLADYRGQVLVLNFWATWCPPCRAEIPDFVRVQEDWRDRGVRFVGVSLDQGDKDKLVQFAERYDINYPIVRGTPEMVAAYGDIRSIPTTFIIDREGAIRERIVGSIDEERLRETLEPYLDRTAEGTLAAPKATSAALR